METTKTGKNIPKNWPREIFTVVDAGGMSYLRVAFSQGAHVRRTLYLPVAERWLEE